MNESRKDDRLNVALIMRYREPTMIEPREGQCQNVSRSGMCVATPKPSPRGALIRFECVSGGAAEGIRGTARVVWQRSKSDARGPSAMGVRFVRLEPGCREVLEGLLEQLGGGVRAADAQAPRASSSSNPPRRSERPGASTMLIAPSGGSGVTQQGMGKARSRSAHYPTLRGMGIPSSAPARPTVSSSNPPPSGATDGGAGSSHPPLGVTLPGHATTTPTPFPTTPSAPPDPPARGGFLRGRLDRTRRGMPPLDVPDDEPLPGNGAIPLEALGSDQAHPAGENHAGRDRRSDRPPRPGSVDDLRGFPVPSGSDGYEDAAFGEATAEPVDDETAAEARRRARAAAVSFAPPALALPDPDPVRRKNWLPWIVIGTGLAVSWLMIKVFGSAPAGVPVGPNTGTSTAAEASPAAATESSAAAATVTTNAPAPVLAFRTGGYVLEVASDPPGARVSAADQVVLAPAVLELATVSGPITVKAELDGREAIATVAPADFQLKDGRHVHQLLLKLPATAGAAGAAAEVEQTAGTEPSGKPERDRGSARDAASKPSARAARSERSTPRRSGSSASKPATPLIAAPPVPIDDAAPAASPADSAQSAPAEPAESAGPVASISDRSVLETALECLSRGDNLCVVSTLEGRARTARELEVLIETHLALGNSADAERSMRRYLERFTDGKSAAKYQRWLERRGEPASPSAP